MQNKKASPPKQDSAVQAQPSQDKYPQKSNKAHALNSSTAREEKQPEGCDKDPKSMEESEEKPPEGYNKNPKPMTPKPGAAQLWLAGLKTKEEVEKKKNKSNQMK